MNFLRKALETDAGKMVGGIVVLIFFLAALHAVIKVINSGGPDGSATYICTETGKTFQHKDKEGDPYPMYSPYSGKNTGVRAEPCYWTKDGNIKKNPTWVLLNSLAGKPEPTFCPDCGRLVVRGNPRPEPGATPPPTQEEYEARHPQPGGSE